MGQGRWLSPSFWIFLLQAWQIPTRTSKLFPAAASPKIIFFFSEKHQPALFHPRILNWNQFPRSFWLSLLSFPSWWLLIPGQDLPALFSTSQLWPAPCCFTPTSFAGLPRMPTPAPSPCVNFCWKLTIGCWLSDDAEHHNLTLKTNGLMLKGERTKASARYVFFFLPFG